MTGGPPVVVEINALADGRRNETQHPLPLVLHGIPIVAHRCRNAEVNAKARSESLDVGGDAVSLEQIIEAAVKSIRHAVNVIVKAGLSITRITWD